MNTFDCPQFVAIRAFVRHNITYRIYRACEHETLDSCRVCLSEYILRALESALSSLS